LESSVAPAESAILRPTAEGGDVGATGLSANPSQYRDRLREQTDDQIDSWAEELMRDVAIRRGVARVVADVQRTCRLDERSFRRVFARGGGPAATIGPDAQGRLTVPAITLHCLVGGLRADSPDARDRLTDYLVANFDEIVYV
jgi:hypothetical protein